MFIAISIVMITFISDRLFNAERINCLKHFSIEQNQFLIGGYDSGHLVVYRKNNLD